MSYQNFLSQESSNYDVNTNLNIQNIENTISVLFSQINCYHKSCNYLITNITNISNLVKNLYEQNVLTEEQCLYHKKQAENTDDKSVKFDELQNIVAQIHASQENANAAFAISHSVQLQAQASQSFANAAFNICQRINEISSSLENYNFNQKIDNLQNDSNRLSSDVQILSESIQATYYAIQNNSERLQNTVNNMQNIANQVSNYIL